ncbi:PH domain-containing protein [Lacticaseibacillus nasuensis]|uniref:PH domain-containing protein n=1 Tax=Lacticaseibacillus nasuensis TaxID=944671 RepID=UPI0022467D2B|nr:PH domain-containing protein [Lacticaseibacillus nasuensis]MCX2455827.1 PH domain-containing protein [Lacticaseibacillus nasuensis]
MTPKHLPLLALVLMLIEEVKSWGWALLIMVVGLFKGGGLQALAGGLAILALCLVLVGVRYGRFTYLLDVDAVTINTGLFVRKVRHIPYAKIQTVQRQQWFFLRPFHLESVTLETSGQEGKGGEAALYAVPLSVATAIEARRHHPEPTEPTPAVAPQAAPATPAGPSYRIDAHDLNVFALTSLGFIPIITGMFWLIDKFTDLAPDSWQHTIDNQMAHLAVVLLAALIVIVLVIGLAVSYLNILQRYFHFTLTRTGETLTATRGLFKTISVSVRLNRIQALRFKQSLLRQWCGLTTIQALTASNAADDEKENDLVMLPVVRTAASLATARRFVAWLPAIAPTLTMVAPTHRWYYVRNVLIGNLVWLVPGLAAVGIWLPSWLGWAGLGAVLWLVFFGAQAYNAARQSGVAVAAETILCVQTGSWWARERFYVRRANIQSLTVKNSVWLAQHNLGHLEVNVRAGDSNEALTVNYLPLATITEILTWYQPTAPFLLATD